MNAKPRGASAGGISCRKQGDELVVRFEGRLKAETVLDDLPDELARPGPYKHLRLIFGDNCVLDQLTTSALVVVMRRQLVRFEALRMEGLPYGVVRRLTLSSQPQQP